MKNVETKAIILDAGGVLVSEPVPDTLRYATENTSLTPEEAMTLYKENLYFGQENCALKIFGRSWLCYWGRKNLQGA